MKKFKLYYEFEVNAPDEQTARKRASEFVRDNPPLEDEWIVLSGFNNSNVKLDEVNEMNESTMKERSD